MMSIYTLYKQSFAFQIGPCQNPENVVKPRESARRLVFLAPVPLHTSIDITCFKFFLSAAELIADQVLPENSADITLYFLSLFSREITST